MKYVLNSEPIKSVYSHPYQPLWNDFDCDNFKNIQYNDIDRKKLSPYCRHILSMMYYQIREHKKYQYVFIRIQDLQIGENTSGTGQWHLDSSMNPVEEYENYIFTSGFHNNTEFFKNPIEVNHVKTAYDLHKQLESSYSQQRDSHILDPITVYKYNGSNAHRGRIVQVPEKRMLIRLSNTNAKLSVYH